MLDVSISNAIGTDLSDKISVLHHPHIILPTSQESLDKREISRALDSCLDPSFSHFRFSYCNRRVGPQAYQIRCRNPNTNHLRIENGVCSSSEICVDRALPRHEHRRAISRLVAYCVSMQNFVRLANIVLQHPVTAYSPFHELPGRDGYAVEAVMTSLDNTTSVFAQNLTIQAQAKDEISNTQLWGTLVNGSNTCNNCAAIRLGKQTFTSCHARFQ